MSEMLERKGPPAVAAASVTRALAHIVTESFDVLITGPAHAPCRRRFYRGLSQWATPSRTPYPCSLAAPRWAKCHGRDFFEADEILVKPSIRESPPHSFANK
jgi:hypothetical protein